MDGNADGNDRDRLRRHYEIERELAAFKVRPDDERL